MRPRLFPGLHETLLFERLRERRAVARRHHATQRVQIGSDRNAALEQLRAVRRQREQRRRAGLLSEHHQYARSRHVHVGRRIARLGVGDDLEALLARARIGLDLALDGAQELARSASLAIALAR